MSAAEVLDRTTEAFRVRNASLRGAMLRLDLRRHSLVASVTLLSIGRIRLGIWSVRCR